jgi:predicted phosphodiesterase
VDVLRRPEVRAALLEAAPHCDRLVLLGDTVELRHGPLQEALGVAEPVMRELGEALGREREVVIVVGNHDHGLLAGWLARRAVQPDVAPLGLGQAVDWRDGELLGMLAGWLAPATVRVSYPGVWLRDDVYAIHGHYADRHNTVPIIERLGAGLMARIVVEPDGGPRRAEDYEAILRPMYAWIESVAQSGGIRGRGSGRLQVRAWRMLEQPGAGRKLRRAGVSAGFSALIALLNRAQVGPFGTDVTGPELRRAGLRAFEQVLERLGARAPHVIFGHTHRAGPLPGDEMWEWTRGGSALLNTGSWTYDREFVGDSLSGNPYRPGFCAMLGDEGPPRLLNLLDGPQPARA